MRFYFKVGFIFLGTLGLFVFFQNCSKTKSPIQSSTGLASVSSVDPCAPENPRSCNFPNGVGQYTCSANGIPGDCKVVGCNSGFNLLNNSCVSKLCTSGSQVSCRTANGSGVQICKTDGSGYGSCLENSCNSGFILQNGICVSQTCSVNTTQQCNVQNGVGIQQCIADINKVTSWGSCTPSSCNSGYILSGGACVSGQCIAGATKSCTGINGQGSQTCLSNATWGSCQYSSCNQGYSLQGGQCVANLCAPYTGTIPCGESNGFGVQYCNAQGTGYGACYLSECNAGYIMMSGICVAQTCSPGVIKSCQFENGTGSQYCNSQGTSYGACQLSACNSGYKLQSGVCVKDTPTVSPVQLTTTKYNCAMGASFTTESGQLVDWACNCTGDMSPWINMGATNCYDKPRNSILTASEPYPAILNSQNKINGFVEGFRNGNLEGWVCNYGINRPLQIVVYGKTTDPNAPTMKYIAGALANNGSEQGVLDACGVANGGYRFSIAAPSATNLRGLSIYVYGVSISGDNYNKELNGSGVHLSP